MKKALVLFSLSLMMFCSSIFAGQDLISKKMTEEFLRLRSYAQTLTPDYTIGELMNAKEFEDGVTFLWMLSSDSDVIRIYRDDNPAFVISYYKNTLIGQGEMVLRRFVGPDNVGWRNDTILWETKEYLGSQGSQKPFLKEIDLKVMKTWEVELF